MPRRKPRVSHTPTIIKAGMGKLTPVSGFLAEDGKFFVLECDAEYHSARVELERFLLDQQTSPNRVFALIDKATDKFRRYIDAAKKIEANPNRSRQDPPTEAGTPDED